MMQKYVCVILRVHLSQKEELLHSFIKNRKNAKSVPSTKRLNKSASLSKNNAAG